MPYIEAKDRKILEHDINVLGTHLLRLIGENRRSGKFFFFRFLTILFEILQEMIVNEEGGMRYKHFNHLDGAFGCAWKELLRRWGDLVPLRPKFNTGEALERVTKKFVKESDVELLRILVRNIVEHFGGAEKDGGVNVIVGELNFTISEIANMLANSEKVSHQELLNMAFAATNFLYLTYAGPYEDKAINKNGDTAGFRTFYEKKSSKLRTDAR